jgi:hypothetical protein
VRTTVGNPKTTTILKNNDDLDKIETDPPHDHTGQKDTKRSPRKMIATLPNSVQHHLVAQHPVH